MFKIFTRKPHLAHQLVGEHVDNIYGKPTLRYRCTVCTLTFTRATDANAEQCLGKVCYFAHAAAPQWLMRKEEVEATNRVVTQEPSAYIYNPYMGKKPIITPLYDVRECLELSNTIPLPDLE
jgi:hypothetical protein